ncbi:hypothetical protein SELMODRAFT_413152 [Selaginella moellendorffii]|uniref:Uncharacterized protein n=1 Tax=Selaginella moellendorffii TaxID=88036 RepID=D8RNI5_SELML|nr:hypothetical protein SELMODRAFT_413152 [Selaginella moellendorffii]
MTKSIESNNKRCNCNKKLSRNLSSSGCGRLLVRKNCSSYGKKDEEMNMKCTNYGHCISIKKWFLLVVRSSKEDGGSCNCYTTPEGGFGVSQVIWTGGRHWTGTLTDNGHAFQADDKVLHSWVDREIEVALHVHEVRVAYDKQSEARTALANELSKLKAEEMYDRSYNAQNGCDLQDRETEIRELKDKIVELNDALKLSDARRQELDRQQRLKEQAVAVALAAATKAGADVSEMWNGGAVVGFLTTCSLRIQALAVYYKQ